MNSSTRGEQFEPARTIGAIGQKRFTGRDNGRATSKTVQQRGALNKGKAHEEILLLSEVAFDRAGKNRKGVGNES